MMDIQSHKYIKINFYSECPHIKFPYYCMSFIFNSKQRENCLQHFERLLQATGLENKPDKSRGYTVKLFNLSVIKYLEQLLSSYSSEAQECSYVFIVRMLYLGNRLLMQRHQKLWMKQQLIDSYFTPICTQLASHYTK